MRISRIGSVLLAMLVVGPALAQPVPSREPGSTHIFPAGGRRGSVVSVQVGGECLPPQTRFRIWGDGVAAPPVLGPKIAGNLEPSPRRKPTLIPISYAKQWQSKIEIAPDATLGTRVWRLSCDRAGTPGRPFIVGDLPELIETESNSIARDAERITLPVTVNGRIAGERDLDYYIFTAAKGQVVTCDVMAGRLGSLPDAVVEVLDERGRRVPVQEIRMGGDPVAAFRAPRDGDYLLLVSSVSFHGGPEYVYRMTVTTEPYAAYVFPPGGQAGKSAQVELFCLGGVSDETRMPVLRVLKETVPLAHAEVGPLWHRSEVAAAAPIPLYVGDVPETVETEGNDAADRAMSLDLPVTVHGRFLNSADEDWFAFTAKKGQSLSIQCRPFPTGGRALPILELTDAAGKVLLKHTSIDAADRAIRIQWQAPADGRYRLHLMDVQHGVRGGPGFIYRLTVGTAQPDYALGLAADFAGVIQGDKTQIGIQLDRKGGFDGPVDVVVEGLPEGVRAEKTQIAKGKSSADLVLVAEEGAQPTDASLRIVGRSEIGGKTVERVAQATHLGRDAEGVSVGSPRVDHLHLTVRHKPVFRLFCEEAYQYAHRGTVHMYAMEVERLGDFKGPIVLEMGDRQNRDVDGVQILTIVVPPEVTNVDVPIYFPESMHINVVSLTQLYTQGYALYKDKHGQELSTLVVLEKRNLIRTMSPVVKLKAGQDEIVARPSGTLTCELLLERTSNFPGAMDIKLQSPAGESGITALPLRIEAGEDRGSVTLAFAPDVSTNPNTSLTFRAVGKLRGEITVISETTVPVRWAE